MEGGEKEREGEEQDRKQSPGDREKGDQCAQIRVHVCTIRCPGEHCLLHQSPRGRVWEDGAQDEEGRQQHAAPACRLPRRGPDECAAASERRAGLLVNGE